MSARSVKIELEATRRFGAVVSSPKRQAFIDGAMCADTIPNYEEIKRVNDIAVWNCCQWLKAHSHEFMTEVDGVRVLDTEKAAGAMWADNRVKYPLEENNKNLLKKFGK